MNSDNSTNIVFLLGRSPHLSKGWRFSFKAFKWPSDRQKQIHFRTHMVFICQISNNFYSTKNCVLSRLKVVLTLAKIVANRDKK